MHHGDHGLLHLGVAVFEDIDAFALESEDERLRLVAVLAFCQVFLQLEEL